MKRAFGLIAATLLTTSIYSQDYSSSGSTSNPDSTPDYRSRQSEAGAPATDESSSSSSAGYDKAPGLSGGNSSTGQSNGANIGSAAEQDKSLTTRDSDLSGSEYHGAPQSESELKFDTSGELRGSNSSDSAFHEPAAPVREGSKSEGWSGAGTFSGAGPGSVTGSASSTDSSSSSSSSNSTIPSPTETSNNFSADVSNNSALSNRDEDLSNRGLELDSEQLSRADAFSNRVEGDINNDDTLILQDWTVITPSSESNVGAPAESESGTGSSSDLSNHDRFDSTTSGLINKDSYSQDLYQRMQRDWSARTRTTDVPAIPGLMDKSLEELGQLRFYNDTTQRDVGAPGSNVSGSGKSSSEADAECDTHKGSAAQNEQGERSGSETSAPGEYGDRPDSSNYDDGHLNGNNAAGSSGSSESSSNDSNSDESSRSTDGALNHPDL